MKYASDVTLHLFPEQETHEARRQRGHDLAKLWVDGERGEVLQATRKSTGLLSATVLSLVEADCIDEAMLLCERMMGIEKSDK